MNRDAHSAPQLVRDLMSVGVPTCALDDSVSELTRWFLEKDIEGAVVLDENGHGAGVVTHDELVKAYARGDYENLTAHEIMQVKLPQVPPDIPLTAAAQIMQDQGVRILFITHHAGGIEYPAAYLSYKHLLRHLGARDENELRDLGIQAERESPIETFMRRRDEALRRARSQRR
ncbi:MAG: CBS domain-containing protein [Anaerolineaceae bacterium]|jgi:predicted transcriptional regulator|nr:CBS domain-containing protein [Chloroflexota bacterium]UCC51862.1 MAG: CBS domain-containing protein [Anaerolineaceae bacterium]